MSNKYQYWSKQSACARTLCVRTNVVRALADVVVTKLSIILLLSFLIHLLFSQKGFANDFEFLHAFQATKNWGDPPFTPQIVNLGGQQAFEPVKLQLQLGVTFVGGAKQKEVFALWESEDPLV